MTKHPVDVQSGPATHAEPVQNQGPMEHPSEIQHAPLSNPLETTRINHEYLHELTEEQLKEREVIERE